jgi:hypothetical protein
MHTLDQLLDIEARAGFWDAEVMGVHLWPAIRASALEGVLLSGIQYPAPQVSRTTTLLRTLPKHLRTLHGLLFSERRCSVVFFKPGVDRITPYYYGRLAHPLLIEASWHGKTHEADWAGDHEILLEDTLKSWLYLQARVKPLPQREIRIIEAFAAHVSETFDLNDKRQGLINRMIVHVQRYRDVRPLLWRRILPRLQSQLAVIHMASYMGITAAITKALHDAGFTVAEAQHGLTALTDRSYNFPAVCMQPDHPARLYLPDVLLTFGSSWSNYMRLPSRKVPIGFPLLEESIERMRDVQANPKHVLVISQWTVNQPLADLVAQAAGLLPDYHFIYKLHPREVNGPFNSLRGLPNVEVATEGNIHDWIARCGIIVGYNSTALAEAVAFPNKRLFILKNDGVPEGIGQAFTDVITLVEGIRNPDAGYPSVNPRDFWAENWQTRIDAFFSEYTP